MNDPSCSTKANQPYYFPDKMDEFAYDTNSGNVIELSIPKTNPMLDLTIAGVAIDPIPMPNFYATMEYVFGDFDPSKCGWDEVPEHAAAWFDPSWMPYTKISPNPIVSLKNNVVAGERLKAWRQAYCASHGGTWTQDANGFWYCKYPHEWSGSWYSQQNYTHDYTQHHHFEGKLNEWQQNAGSIKGKSGPSGEQYARAQNRGSQFLKWMKQNPSPTKGQITSWFKGLNRRR
jgi:hypothetical protein